MAQEWTRSELKDRAKGTLRKCYWQAVLLCLIAALLGAGTDSVSFSGRRDAATGSTGISIGGRPGVNFSYSGGSRVKINTPVSEISFAVGMNVGRMLMFFVMMTLMILLVVGILVSNVVQVGKRRYFLKHAAGLEETGLGELFSGFKEGYGNLLLVMLLKDLSVLLWTLLLIIPGIVKSYEYYMVPYLLAENPYLTWEEAREKAAE